MGRKQKRSTRNIRWCEEHLRIPEGKFGGQPLKMAPFMKEDFRAIYDNPAGTRRAIISRGRKNAKTTECAMILALHLVGPEAVFNGAMFSTAQSRDQAAVLFNLAWRMIRQSPTLVEHVKILESSKRLSCEELGTTYRALSSDAPTAFGLSPVLVIHDELGQVRGPRSPLYEAMETASAAQEAPLSLVISTQAPNDDDLLSVLIDDAASGADPRTVLRLNSAPMDLDPFSEAAIKAANPAYGIFMNRAEVLDQAASARRMPARENEYRNLILNQRVEANDPYVTGAVWDACAGAVVDEWPEGVEVFGGLDLSAVRDLTAYVQVGWIGDELHARSRFWLPSAGLVDKSTADAVTYDLWADEGHLETTPGATVDYDYIAPIILADIRRGNLVRVNFDRWNWRFFRPALVRAGASERELEVFQEFGQGTKDMTPALRLLDGHLLNARLRHGDHPVLRHCMQNTVVREDKAGNRALAKSSAKKRIDGMVALAMAVASAGDPPVSQGKSFWATL